MSLNVCEAASYLPASITHHASRITHHALHITLSALFLLLFLLITRPAAAQTPVSDDAVNEIAKDLYCPVCENTPLDVCPTQACADWRELIRQQLSEGRSKEEITAYFVEQYGDRVLATPPRRGFNWLVWALPIVGIIVGAFFFGRYLQNLKSPAETPPKPAPEATVTSPTTKSEYLEQLEKELREKI